MTLSFGSSCEFRYTNADCIGQGAFGIVFLAAVTERGTFSGEDAVAVKVIQMGKDNPLLQTLENWEKFLQRSQKLLELQHSHLVRYHKLSITDTPHGGKVVDFVMDHCNGGDLALFLKDLKTKNLKLDYTDVIRFSMEITAGLQFLHANEIIHGDLKPANIFLKRRNDGQHTLLIGDLDDYVQMHKPVTTARDIPQYRGTVRYMSPEMLQKYTCQGDEVIGRKTDVWSIGCIIAEMSNSSAWDFGNCLCNWSTRELFQIQDSTPNQIFIDKILNGFVPYIQKSDAGVMDSCVASCFSRQAEDRTSAGMLLQKIRGFGTKRFPGRLLEVATIHLNARKTIPVGMDLGKSYSCVAAFIDGKVITIPNDQGNRMTPSVVCFVAGDRLVGESAAMCRCESLTNTICDVKLMIGRSFDDPLIQTDIANWDFRVAEKNGKFNIVVEENGEDMLLTPEQVTAMILYNMKDSAEIFLQSTICDVVLTVPVYFTNAQRQATKDAATIAGLNVLAMINEPTAAAMYLGTETKIKRNQKILMLRLGSSTLSISILIKEPNEHFTVVASHRNPHLGGNDFVDALTRILAEEYDQQHQEKLAHDPEAVERLREACKHSKKILDYGFDRKIVLSNFTGGKSYQRIVTRTEYETVCKDLFSSILAQVQATLRTAHLTVADIEHVALVGKSSRVPKVKELLQQLFIGKNVKDSAAPDEVVACGAAVYAASLMGHNICKKDSEDVNSLDP